MELIGEIDITDSTKVCFLISTYNDRRYGVVRKFITGGEYVGPTKHGLNAQRGVWQGILELIQLINHDSSNIDTINLGKIKINAGCFAMVSISYLRGNYYLQIQKYYESAKYTGPGKGVAIPFIHIEVTKKYLKEIIDLLDENHIVLDHNSENSAISVPINNIEGVTDEYREFF